MASEVRAGNQTLERVGVQGNTPEMIYLTQVEVASGRYLSQFIVGIFHNGLVAATIHVLYDAVHPAAMVIKIFCKQGIVLRIGAGFLLGKMPP